MARTYYAEGRNMAKVVRGLSGLVGLTVFFTTELRNIWWMLFVVLFGSVLVGELAGAKWTRKKRAAKQRVAKSSPSRGGSAQPSAAKVKRKLTEAELLGADMYTLSGTDFERLMMLFYQDQGYKVEQVGGAGDHEVDLILVGKEGYKIAVQCKRWKQDVGNDIVLRLKDGKQVHGCYDAWIVTTSNFTKAAREAAERLNIQLINGLMLEDRMKRWRRKTEGGQLRAQQNKLGHTN